MAVPPTVLRAPDVRNLTNGVEPARSARADTSRARQQPRGGPGSLVPGAAAAVGAAAGGLTLLLGWNGPAGPGWAALVAALIALTASGVSAAAVALWEVRRLQVEVPPASVSMPVFEIVLRRGGTRRVARVAASTKAAALELLDPSLGEPLAVREAAATNQATPGILRVGPWLADN